MAANDALNTRYNLAAFGLRFHSNSTAGQNCVSRSGLASERAEQRKLNDEDLRDALAEFRVAHGLPQRFQRLEPRSSLDHTQAHAFLGAGDPPPRHRQMAVFASMGRSDFSTEVERSSFLRIRRRIYGHDGLDKIGVTGIH